MALLPRPRGARRRRTTPRRLLAGLAGLGLAAAFTAPVTPAAAAPAPAAESTPNQATVLSAKTYPGIQLIEVDYTATITVPEPTLDEAALSDLVDRLARQVAIGTIASTESALVDAMITEFSKDPLTYFQPSGKLISEEASLSGFGTGWVVTPDGYMITAAHVIKADPAEIKTQFATATLDAIAKEAVAEVQSSDVTLSTEQAEKLGLALTKYAEKHLTVNDLKSAVSAQIGVAVAGFKKSQKGRPVEIKAVGEPYPGKDVALLKLDGEQHLPTLPVGTNDDVAEGDTLFVAGYPAASTFYSGLSEDSEVQPSITQGPLTAVKSSASGTPIFQTQAPASPGNSGGPVLDDSGKVVGVLVASAVNEQGVALEGQEFVIPVSVVSEMLKEHNVTPATSDTTTTYDEAVDEFYAHHYKAALPLFQKASSLYQGHPYAGDFISKSTAAIDAGKDETPRPMWLWVALGAGGLGIVVLVVVLVMASRRRGRGGRTLPQTPVWADAAGRPQGQPQGWSGQYPQGQYPQGQPPAQYPQGQPPAQPGYPQPQHQPQYTQPQYAQPQYPQQYPAPYPTQPGQPGQPGYPQQGDHPQPNPGAYPPQ